MKRIFCRQGSCYLSVHADTGHYLLVLYTCICMHNLNMKFLLLKCLLCGSSKWCQDKCQIVCISCKPANALSSHFRDHFLVVCIITLQKMSRINNPEKDQFERSDEKSHYWLGIYSVNTISTNHVSFKKHSCFRRKWLETSSLAFALKRRYRNWGILHGSSGLWQGTPGMNQRSYHWLLVRPAFLRKHLLFFLERWSVIFSLLLQCFLQQGL